MNALPGVHWVLIRTVQFCRALLLDGSVVDSTDQRICVQNRQPDDRVQVDEESSSNMEGASWILH